MYAMAIRELRATSPVLAPQFQERSRVAPPHPPSPHRLPPATTPHTHTHTHTRTHTRLHPGSPAPKTICETVKLKLLYEINHVRDKPSQPNTLCVSAKL